MDEEDWELLEALVFQSLPGLSMDDIEVQDHFRDEETGMDHFLVNDGIDRYHLWSPDGETTSLDHLEGPDLLLELTRQAGLFRDSSVFKTMDGNELRYQRFGPWKNDTLTPLEQSVSIPCIIKENGNIQIRLDDSDDRYILQIRRSALKGPYSELILSRLNSTGFRNVPTFLGMSYWDDVSDPLTWMKFTLGRRSEGSGFRPFLFDLKRIMGEYHPLGYDKARRYLLDMSRSSNIPSLSSAFRIGSIIGELHGKLMLEEKVKVSRKRGISSSITELFSPSKFRTSDVGSILGITSFYMTELRREFTKLLGDRQRVNPESGRMMKVLKSSRTHIKGIDLFDLGLFRERFLKRQKKMRERFSSLRNLVGAPMVPISIDTRLDRIEIDTKGNFNIEHFDWEFYGAEKGELNKFVPLKDLAMILNSINKARYLASRQMIKKISGKYKFDERQLVSLFLEYNLAKVGYNKIMRDLNLFRAVSSRNVPFRHVFSISVIGSLWFERMRNGLVSGYTEKLHSMGKENILEYPEKANTVEATDAIRSLLGLSSSLEILTRGKVVSMIGLESELMNSICHLDQA